MKKRVAMDIEILPGYFLVMFKDKATGAIRSFDMFAGQNLDTASIFGILSRCEIITFNGNKFDMIILAIALRKKDVTIDDLREATEMIIIRKIAPWHVLEHFGVRELDVDTVDLIEVAPGMASLKIYGGRLHAPKMQDLPFGIDTFIYPEDRETVRKYCVNDLDTTLLLDDALTPQVDLRRRMSVQYEQDLRSKSDAQIAEAVIKSRVAVLTSSIPRKPVIKPGTVYKYKAPSFIAFDTEPLQNVLTMVEAAEFIIDKNGKPGMPPELDAAGITIGAGVYRMGIGGLHSSESCTAHHADDDHILIDRDVASYYPAIILNCGLYPKHMGTSFLDVYRGIVEQRIHAKHTGDKVTADALKITVNGSFGKFGSKYSVLYSPDLLLQTTLTGQLALLMLIEQLHLSDIEVVSANTDGVVIYCAKSKVAQLNAVISLWEFLTGFDTEETQYAAVYSRDVNNYIAVKTDGSTKTKGAYAHTGLAKSPGCEISIDAVIAYLTQGTPIYKTVTECRDIRKFITVRTATGGAIWRDPDGRDHTLGKALRWYYSSVSGEPIRKIKDGSKVSESDGARPVMDLPDVFPGDVDYATYIERAQDILSGFGISINTELEAA